MERYRVCTCCANAPVCPWGVSANAVGNISRAFMRRAKPAARRRGRDELWNIYDHSRCGGQWYLIELHAGGRLRQRRAPATAETEDPSPGRGLLSSEGRWSILMINIRRVPAWSTFTMHFASFCENLSLWNLERIFSANGRSSLCRIPSLQEFYEILKVNSHIDIFL